jgi:hypothetical protein
VQSGDPWWLGKAGMSWGHPWASPFQNSTILSIESYGFGGFWGALILGNLQKHRPIIGDL